MDTTPIQIEPGTFQATVSANTAWALCSAVDAGTAVPPGWEKCWVPDGKNNGAYAIIFQAYVPVLILPWNPPIRVPLPFYAVAIQGTKDLKDVFNDFKIPQVAFPAITNSAISEGASNVLNDVLGLIRTNGGITQTLQGFLKSLTSGDTVLVTGHSLGGQVSSVLTPWMAYNLPAFGATGKPLQGLPSNLSSITFAAPTAGNNYFADFLNNQSTKYQANFNSNDVVSNVWDLVGPLRVERIYKMFTAPGPPPPPPTDVKVTLDAKVLQMTTGKIIYKQTNGTIFDTPSQPVPSGTKDPWMWELGYQHNNAYANQFRQGSTKQAVAGE